MGGGGVIDMGTDADMPLCCTVKLWLPDEHFGVTQYSSPEVVPFPFYYAEETCCYCVASTLFVFPPHPDTKL